MTRWPTRKPRASGPTSTHLAGALEPEDGRRAGRRRIEALALQQIGAVHRRGPDADAQLGRARAPAPARRRA